MAPAEAGRPLSWWMRGLLRFTAVKWIAGSRSPSLEGEHYFVAVMGEIIYGASTQDPDSPGSGSIAKA